MKKILVIAIFVFIQAAQADYCYHTVKKFRCVKFVDNYDGDTLTVNIPNTHKLFGEEIHVRLDGIDTPEMRTANKCEKRLAIQAKKYLRYRILNSDSGKLELRNVKRGKYFRIVAQVWVNGRNLNAAMIKKGLAVAYGGDTKPEVDWCKFRPDLPNDMDQFLDNHKNQ